MKLSELKTLRPDVYDVFVKEMYRVKGKFLTEYSIKGDSRIKEALNWERTEQGPQVWSSIYHASNFTLFDQWAAKTKLNTFYPMAIQPEPGEDCFSKIVIAYYKDGVTNEPQPVISFYDFEGKKWLSFDDEKHDLLCWCYPPDATDFINKL